MPSEVRGIDVVAAEREHALTNVDETRSNPARRAVCLRKGMGHCSSGTLRISRALPVKGRRMIGPWCFLDRFGPLSFTEGTLEYAVLVLTGECRLYGQPLRDR